MKDEAKVELVLDAKAALGEGSLWDAEKKVLYWVDIEGHEVHVYNPETRQDRSFELGETVGTVVVRKSGGLVAALKRSLVHLNLDTGDTEILVGLGDEPSETRFNDGKCDPAGRLWVGTMGSRDGKGIGSLYRIDADLSVHRMVEEIKVSNGLVWDLDHEIFYYIDTPTGCVDAFDYDHDSGEIKNRRTAVKVDPENGRPDGMTLDAEGMIWVACWDGSRVCRYDPRTGNLLQIVKVPAQRVTSCAFGGPALNQLYITTARVGLSDEALRDQPHAGGLFRLNLPGIKGVPAPGFVG